MTTLLNLGIDILEHLEFVNLATGDFLVDNTAVLAAMAPSLKILELRPPQLACFATSACNVRTLHLTIDVMGARSPESIDWNLLSSKTFFPNLQELATHAQMETVTHIYEGMKEFPAKLRAFRDTRGVKVTLNGSENLDVEYKFWKNTAAWWAGMRAFLRKTREDQQRNAGPLVTVKVVET